MKKQFLLLLIITSFLAHIQAQKENFISVEGIRFFCNTESNENGEIIYKPYEMSLVIKVFNVEEDLALVWGSFSPNSLDKNTSKYGFFELNMESITLPFYSDNQDILYILNPHDTIDYSCCLFTTGIIKAELLKAFEVKKDEPFVIFPEISLKYYPLPEDYPNIFNTFFLKEPIEVNVGHFTLMYSTDLDFGNELIIDYQKYK